MGQNQGFEFGCPTPGCGHVYRATLELVGKTILCKSCKQKVKVPAMSNRPVVASASAGTGLPHKARAHAGAVARASQLPARPASSPPAVPRKIAARPAPQPAPTDAEQVQCPSCFSSCRIRPEWRGATLRCPSCKQEFVVPEASADFALADDGATEDAHFVTAELSEEFNSFQPSDDTFGLTESPEAPTYSAVDDDAGPEIQRTTTRSKKKRKRRENFIDRMLDVPRWVKVTGGLVVLVIVLAIVAGLVGSAVVGLGLMVIGFGTMAVGSIWGLCVAFSESTVCGLLYMFVPGGLYQIYYLVTRWDEMRRPFFVVLAGAAIIFLAGFAIGLAGGDLFDANEFNAPGVVPNVGPGASAPANLTRPNVPLLAFVTPGGGLTVRYELFDEPALNFACRRAASHAGRPALHRGHELNRLQSFGVFPSQIVSISS